MGVILHSAASRLAALSALDNIAVTDFAIWTRLQRYVDKFVALNLTRVGREGRPGVKVDSRTRRRGQGDGAPFLDTATFVFTTISEHFYVVRAAEPRGVPVHHEPPLLSRRAAAMFRMVWSGVVVGAFSVVLTNM